MITVTALHISSGRMNRAGVRKNRRRAKWINKYFMSGGSFFPYNASPTVLDDAKWMNCLLRDKRR